MIVVTGAAGFIGSAMISFLIQKGHEDIVAVDEFNRIDKNQNLKGKSILYLIDRYEAIEWMKERVSEIEGVFHLGARTDTTEINYEIFDLLNIKYSKDIWTICSANDIPLIYASSAATYGNGSQGYSDRHEGISQLKPMNPYGESKQIVDEWILKQEAKPSNWQGFKFFNVYGPNEYHKGRMASVVFHTFNQIKETGEMKLFKSHRPDYKDGFQSRDFIYVSDVAKVLYWFYKNKPDNGIYNLGTGVARPFIHLAEAVFHAQNLTPAISFIDTPEDIRETYQYFTEADMRKLKNTGCPIEFTSLENGVAEYVQQYLVNRVYY